MIIRGNSLDGDWIYGIGKNAYKTENNAIAQNIQTKLQEWYGDCFFNLTAGVDWLNRLSNSQQDLLEQDIYSLILKCEGVVGVNQVSTSLVDRKLTINYDVQTVFTQSVQNTITIGN